MSCMMESLEVPECPLDGMAGVLKELVHGRSLGQDEEAM